jgi:hypothetical protein
MQLVAVGLSGAGELVPRSVLLSVMKAVVATDIDRDEIADRRYKGLAAGEQLKVRFTIAQTEPKQASWNAAARVVEWQTRKKRSSSSGSIPSRKSPFSSPHSARIRKMRSAPSLGSEQPLRIPVRTRLAAGGRWIRTSSPPGKTGQTVQTILHPYCAGTELRSSPDSLPEERDSDPSAPARKAGSVPSGSHAMSGSYRLSAPLSPLQESAGDAGHKPVMCRPAGWAKLHISRQSPERRLLRRLAGSGPN